MTTHIYEAEGTYTVTLTVDDTGGNGPTSKSHDVTVARASAGNAFDITTDISPTTSGAAPLSCSIDDLTGFTAGSGQVIDYLYVQITKQQPGENFITSAPSPIVAYLQPSDTFSFTLNEVGEYDLYIAVYVKNVLLPVSTWTYEAAWEVDPAWTRTVEIESYRSGEPLGKGRVPRGPITVDFAALIDGDKQVENVTDYASISWTITGVSGSPFTDWEPSVTFPAVNTATAYDVSVTVTDHEGNDYTKTITDYITIYPAKVAVGDVMKIADTATVSIS